MLTVNFFPIVKNIVRNVLFLISKYIPIGKQRKELLKDVLHYTILFTMIHTLHIIDFRKNPKARVENI